MSLRLQQIVLPWSIAIRSRHYPINNSPVTQKRTFRNNSSMMASRRCMLAILSLAGLLMAIASAPAKGQQAGSRGLRPQQPNLRDKARQLIGIDRIERQIGDMAPIGGGIHVGHVEGNEGNYMPDIDRPGLQGVMITAASGPSIPNGHVTMTAEIIYGPRGLAPGIGDVFCYAARPWLGHAYLGVGTGVAPLATDRRLFNHSWVGGIGSNTVEILRRVDYVIDTHDVIMVVGVDNKADSFVPPLLASAYNVIAVGGWTGNSSGGYTMIEGVGRCKPDIVGPARKTSFATPGVTAVVARLLEAADRIQGCDDAAGAVQSELIKAVLLCGAAKTVKWLPQPGKPLDEHLGAGRVRFEESYQILMAGPAAVGQVHQRDGWYFGTLDLDARTEFLIETLRPRSSVVVALVWNRRISGQQKSPPETTKHRWMDTPRLADFDLRFVAIENIDNFDDQGQQEPLHDSSSNIDNQEHLYVRRLKPGQYRIEVSRKDSLDERWDYAIAWRIETPVARHRSPQNPPDIGARP